MKLVTDRYPDPYVNVLIYDLFNGYAIAHYDNFTDRFIGYCGCGDSVQLEYRNVAGWVDLEKQDLHTTIRDTVNRYRMKAKILSMSKTFEENMDECEDNRTDS